jgi:hypothetical protein
VNRYQPESGRQSRIREHLQRGALILQQSFRYPEYHADDAVPAAGTAYCAVIAVDDHWFSRVGRHCRRPVGLADVRHLAGPLRLLDRLVVTVTAGTDNFPGRFHPTTRREGIHAVSVRLLNVAAWARPLPSS